MQLQEVKDKITTELIDTYLQSFPQCASFQDLVAPTKTMFEKVAQIVIPKFRLEYLPVNVSQDIVIVDERKEKLDSEQKLIALIRNFQRNKKTEMEETERSLAYLIQQRDV
jgi:hypothetical protein